MSRVLEDEVRSLPDAASPHEPDQSAEGDRPSGRVLSLCPREFLAGGLIPLTVLYVDHIDANTTPYHGAETWRSAATGASPRAPVIVDRWWRGRQYTTTHVEPNPGN